MAARTRMVGSVPVWLRPGSPPDSFPDPALALTEPNGLLAVGGDLTPDRLECAYRQGIFPWYGDGQPILWWSPAPRAVLFPTDVHISKSLAKTLRRKRFEVTVNRAFREVIGHCSAPRDGQEGTWITPAMKRAYVRLHTLGLATSVECWTDGRLAGGLYGVAIGKVFFGESMFALAPDASKVALVHLCSMGVELIDCQLPNPHLSRMGAVALPRREFQSLLARWCGPRPLSSPSGRRA
jgi:leucyl/phenylalanyl-tRNA--protein transferase